MPAGLQRLSSWFRVICGVAALAWADVRVASAADAPDSTMDIVQYRAPAGWSPTNANDPARRIYTAPDANATQQAVIMLTLSPQQDKLDLRTAFDGVTKELTRSGKITQSSDVSSSKTRQGFEAMSQTTTVQAENGARLYVRLVCASVNNRLAAFCYVASPQATYDKHLAEMDALLGSVNFTAAKGAAAPAVAGGVPIRDEAAVIAQAVAQFNKTANQRRKPHTILGDILTLDGKPIPNVTTAVVAVVGTTITGGERTGYSMEVDKSGHFEMKVPDGVYRVTPRVVVTVNGHQIPADLVPVDGRVARAELSSADGIVADFRLVLGMLKPGLAGGSPDSYFGGIVSVEDPDYSDHAARVIRRHPGGKIRVTFAPITPAVDGTKLEPFAVDADAQAAAYGTERIGRIPMAAYRVSAAVAMPDGKLIPLGCSLKFNQDFMTAVDLNWTVPYEGSVLRDAVKLYVTE
jgi:hypothetical protein